MNNVVAIKQEVEAESIEFGGVVWVKDKDARYNTHIKGLGESWIIQYTEGPNNGRWFWMAHLGGVLLDLDLAVADNHVSGIAVTRDDAMSACINALDDYLADMRRILLKLQPGDDYAKTASRDRFGAGQMTNAPDITAEEISAAYSASGLHRLRYGLARALENQALYIALRCTALARRKQQHGQPAPTRRAIMPEA